MLKPVLDSKHLTGQKPTNTDTLSDTRTVALYADVYTYGCQNKAFCLDNDVRHGGLVRGTSRLTL